MAEVSALNSSQYLEIVGWVKERATGLQKCANYSREISRKISIQVHMKKDVEMACLCVC